MQTLSPWSPVLANFAAIRSRGNNAGVPRCFPPPPAIGTIQFPPLATTWWLVLLCVRLSGSVHPSLPAHRAPPSLHLQPQHTSTATDLPSCRSATAPISRWLTSPSPTGAKAVDSRRSTSQRMRAMSSPAWPLTVNGSLSAWPTPRFTSSAPRLDSMHTHFSVTMQESGVSPSSAGRIRTAETTTTRLRPSEKRVRWSLPTPRTVAAASRIRLLRMAISVSSTTTHVPMQLTYCYRLPRRRPTYPKRTCLATAPGPPRARARQPRVKHAKRTERGRRCNGSTRLAVHCDVSRA